MFRNIFFYPSFLPKRTRLCFVLVSTEEAELTGAAKVASQVVSVIGWPINMLFMYTVPDCGKVLLSQISNHLIWSDPNCLSRDGKVGTW